MLIEKNCGAKLGNVIPKTQVNQCGLLVRLEEQTPRIGVKVKLKLESFGPTWKEFWNNYFSETTYFRNSRFIFRTDVDGEEEPNDGRTTLAATNTSNVAYSCSKYIYPLFFSAAMLRRGPIYFCYDMLGKLDHFRSTQLAKSWNVSNHVFRYFLPASNQTPIKFNASTMKRLSTSGWLRWT